MKYIEGKEERFVTELDRNFCHQNQLINHSQNLHLFCFLRLRFHSVRRLCSLSGKTDSIRMGEQKERSADGDQNLDLTVRFEFEGPSDFLRCYLSRLN